MSEHQAIYPIDPSIYHSFLVERAISDYGDFMKEQGVEMRYQDAQIIFSSPKELGDLPGEFINYLLFLHVAQ